MNEAVAVVDWSQAELTQRAKNSEPPKRKRVVCIPRESYDKCWPLPWTDLEAHAAANGDGCELWLIAGGDIAPKDHAYMREGTYREPSLRGQSLLYSQGW